MNNGTCLDFNNGIVCTHLSMERNSTHIERYCNKYKRKLVSTTTLRSFIAMKKLVRICPIKEEYDIIIQI